MTQNTYETVIGLEVHIELNTRTKIFCRCSAAFGAQPNTQTCPVCTGMPGALPVLNQQVVENALALAIALECRINPCCRFDRKNYFYPDNPQNYQISQLYAPIGQNGRMKISVQDEEKNIRIHELHMEEDAGKLIHEEFDACSLIDYNRSGVPLIEIVSEPDFGTSDEVIAYLEKLRKICQYLGISDCKLQEGSMRVDVNLSVCRKNAQRLGTRTEMKNLNSFKAIHRAIEKERQRQIALLDDGIEVRQETRRWDDAEGESYSMRSKEDANDYRYFPEPDLPPVWISQKWIERLKNEQPEFQEEKAERYQQEYALSAYDADLVTQNRTLADLFEKTAKLCGSYKKTANWFTVDILRYLKESKKEPEQLSFSPKHLADLISSVEKGEINLANARKVFLAVMEEDADPLRYMKEQCLLMISDPQQIKEAIISVLREQQEIVAEWKSGKEKVFGFLVGQVMKKLKGKADPALVNELLKNEILSVK